MYIDKVFRWMLNKYFLVCLWKVGWHGLLSTSAIISQYLLTHYGVAQEVKLGPVHLPLKLSPSTFSSSLTPVNHPCVTAWIAALKLICRIDHGHEWPEAVQVKMESGLSGMLPDYTYEEQRYHPATPFHPDPCFSRPLWFRQFLSQFLLCSVPPTPLWTCHHICCSLCPLHMSLTHVPHGIQTQEPRGFQSVKYFLFFTAMWFIFYCVHADVSL